MHLLKQCSMHKPMSTKMGLGTASSELKITLTLCVGRSVCPDIFDFAWNRIDKKFFQSCKDIDINAGHGKLA